MEVKKSNWRKFLDIFSNTDKVLVTGGLGYVGSHTVVELMLAGYEVLVVDNLSNANIDTLHGIEQITGQKPQFENIDCIDFVAMDHFLSRNEDIKCVVNFASYKSVGDSRRNPTKYYRNNLMTNVNLMELLPLHKILGIVQSSSCTVYGQITKNPIDEKTTKRTPLSPFSNTQQIAEEIICDSINAGNNLQGIVLRYFNAIGAHPSGEIGENLQGSPSNIVPMIMQVALGQRETIRIFGNDYNTPDGSVIRDYVDVVDIAKAHVKAVERICKKKCKGVETYNLGTGVGYSMFDMISAFEQATGLHIPYEIVERKKGDIEKVWVNPKKVNEILKWEAQVPLEETLINAWKWYMNK
ncbi:MAG: UDP-glucose 4-epimerase GalE [Bacteroidales bacterium]|nr:UDP-glucose 4-epimerase GalE [Bacteroidales bacterium]